MVKEKKIRIKIFEISCKQFHVTRLSVLYFYKRFFLENFYILKNDDLNVFYIRHFYVLKKNEKQNFKKPSKNIYEILIFHEFII